MLDKISDVWVEKYRPTNLDEYVDGSINKELIKKFIDNPKDMPHLLLVSKQPGTGKTSIANVIINALDTDYLILNSSMDRGIDIVRERLSIFASTSNRNADVPKIVFLDEADGMLGQTQDSLRNLMETYFTNCRFILTANNENKIIDPIKSRCMQISLANPDKEQIQSRVYGILCKENVSFKKEVVDQVISDNYPNIRNILIYLQKVYLETGNINYDTSKLYSKEKDIYSLLKQKAFIKARDLWYATGISPQFLTHSLYKIIMEDTLEEVNKKKAIMLIAKYSYQMSCGAEPEIQLMSLFVELTGVV